MYIRSTYVVYFTYYIHMYYLGTMNPLLRSPTNIVLLVMHKYLPLACNIIEWIGVSDTTYMYIVLLHM